MNLQDDASPARLRSLVAHKEKKKKVEDIDRNIWAIYYNCVDMQMIVKEAADSSHFHRGSCYPLFLTVFQVFLANFELALLHFWKRSS